MSKRHERISFQLHKFDVERIRGFADEWGNQFNRRESFTAATKFGRRERSIFDAMTILALHHLELPSSNPVEYWVVEGAKCVKHLFLEDIDYPTSGDDIGGYWYSKQKGLGLYYWFVAYMEGLIIAFLSRNEELITGLCNWPWATLEPEFSGLSEYEDELQFMFMIMTSSLRETSMDGVEGLVDKVEKTRSRRPKLLKDVWDAVEARDQSRFDAALLKSMKQYKRTLKVLNDGKFAERLALPQSAFALAAEYSGLKIPELPIDLGDYLITRESLGLDPNWSWENK